MFLFLPFVWKVFHFGLVKKFEIQKVFFFSAIDKRVTEVEGGFVYLCIFIKLRSVYLFALSFDF